MTLPAIGTPFPTFTLPDQAGRPTSLASLLGAPLVIYCYPEADTPLCTRQACDFNAAVARLAALDVRVVGLSPDSTPARAAFAQKFGLEFPLLGDEPAKPGADPRFLTKIGVWAQKKMYGNLVTGILRTTFILDAQGVVRRRFDRVRTPGHVEAVIEALGELTGPAPEPKAQSSRASRPSGPRTTRTPAPSRPSRSSR